MLPTNTGRLKLFVESKKVPVGTTTFSRQMAVGPWTYSQSPVTVVLYERVLDDSQARLLEEARQISSNSGMDLEVIDLGKMSPIRRAFMARFIGHGLTAALSNRDPASVK